MKPNPKVSIVTVCFNSESHIRKTIQSVLSQTYKNIEYIIIDGDSKDQTKSIISHYKSKISILVSEPDKGLYDALNKGISLATGDIICNLHSDDIFYNSSTIASVVCKFKTQNINLLYGNISYTLMHNKHLILRYWRSGPFYLTKLKYGWMAPHTSIFIKRSLIRHLNNYSLAYRISADYEWMINAFTNTKTKPYFFNETITKMSLGGLSTNFTGFFLKFSEDKKITEIYFKYPKFVLLCKNLRKLSQFLSFY